MDGEEASNFYQYDVSLLTDGAYKDAKLDLNVRLYPNNANYASVTWTSSTDKIVISENGVASPAKNTSFNVLKNEGLLRQDHLYGYGSLRPDLDGRCVGILCVHTCHRHYHF